MTTIVDTMINNNNGNGNCNDTAAAAAAASGTSTHTNGDGDGGSVKPQQERLLARRQVQLKEFLSLEVPHPYGVQPEGNRFLHTVDATTPSTTTSATISSPTHLLTDECWNAILQFCNGVDLVRVGQTCRYFYVSSHLPELWRDLVLHKMHHHNTNASYCNGNAKNEETKKEKVLEHFYHSWKDTYIRCYLSMDCNPQDSLQKLEQLHPHHPMQVAGIYSDFLYRLHTCRSFAIPEEWLTCATKQQQQRQKQPDVDGNGEQQPLYDNQGLVPRVAASDMDVQRFQDEFENANFPVVIAGGAADWKATQQWHQLSYLLQMATIEPPVTATSSSSNNNGVSSMADAIAAAAASNTSFDVGAVLKKQAPDQQQQQQQQEEQQQQESLSEAEHSHYHGQMTFRATSGTAPLPATFTLPAYLDYCETSETNLMEEAPLYLFDRSSLIQPTTATEEEEGAKDSTTSARAAAPHYACFDDFRPCLARTCPYWDSQQSRQHDLFRLLGEGARPDHTWLIIGARRSGSVFHIDPNATHAWNATIVGRKRWIFYPPTSAATGIYSNSSDGDENDHMPPPGVYPSPDGDSVALPLSVGEWLQQFWPEHCRRMKQYSAKQQKQQQQQRHFLRPLECTTGAGDIVFVPHGWWHTVVNLDEINIAITHNYVSGGSSCVNGSSGSTTVAAAADHNNSNNKKQKNKHSNLPDVLRFLRDKRDQVSGCRDRPNEAIQPGCLYEEFVAALKRHYPDMLESALEVVQQQEQWEQEHHQSQVQEQSKSRNMLDSLRHHQERKKRHREQLHNDDEAKRCKKTSSTAAADQEDTSIMAKGKSENENGNFSFSFF